MARDSKPPRQHGLSEMLEEEQEQHVCEILYKSPFRLVATTPAPCAPYNDLVRKCVQFEAVGSHKDKPVQAAAAMPRHCPAQPPLPSSAPENTLANAIAVLTPTTFVGLDDTTVWGDQTLPSRLPCKPLAHSAADSAWLSPIGTTGHTLAPALYNESYAWPLDTEETLAIEDELMSSDAMIQHLSLRPKAQQDRSSWSRFLRRTELLGWLLLLSVEIPGIQERAPRLQERFIPSKASPKHSATPTAMSPANGQENATTFGDALLTSLLDESVRPTASILDAPTTDIPDLISFVDFEPEGSEEPDSQTNEDAQAQTPFKPIIDYFQYYTKLDHHGLWSVLTLLFPGSGRRGYDRTQAEIELGILKYCAPRVESMQITNPRLVIPYMLEHGAQFAKLKEIELLDKSWKADELKLVCDFLTAHAQRFPSATAFAPTANPQLHEGNSTRMTTSGWRILPADRSHAFSGNFSGIRRLKYRSSRSPWDNVKLNNKCFDPLQLLLALGPGVNEIDMLYWPKTQLSDVMSGRIDAGAIRHLQLRYLDTPTEPSPWHAPEFLQQCRRLEHLQIFILDGDLFSWAVQEQQTRRLQIHPQPQRRHDQQNRPRATRGISDSSLSTTSILTPPTTVPLRDLRLTAPNDDILGEALVSALYAFQQTLEVVDFRSHLKRRERTCFDPSHTDYDTVRPPPSSSSSSQLSSNIRAKASSRHDPAEAKTNGDHVGSPLGTTESKDQEQANANAWEDDDDGFRSWMIHAPVTVRWPMTRLRELRLVGGGLALEFDLGSLQWMPNLHTLVLGIQKESLYNERFRWKCDQAHFTTLPTSVASDARRQSLMYLPYVAGPRLRRIMIQGPWPEISDCTLNKMIHTAVDSNTSSILSSMSQESEQQQQPTRKRWGDSLLELTVLDNLEVTVQGMTHLAACLEHVQIVGFNTNICRRESTQSWQRYRRLKYVMKRNRQQQHHSAMQSGWATPPMASYNDYRDADWMWDWWEKDYHDLDDLDDDDYYDRQEEDEDGEEDEEEDALLEIWPDARPPRPATAPCEALMDEDEAFLQQQQQWLERRQQRQQRREGPTEDLGHVVEDWLLRAQIALPWVDIGSDALHLGRRSTTTRHSEHGWMS
ncbi:hypothetical protein BGZ73_003856 [Actinomortierella ambigua]|nr:hypothetical protein BGZ73_003856 [Actinomortierella ambigua]